LLISQRMKRSLKYILVILVNFTVLWGLSKLWIDPFELAFNEGVEFYEIAKIIGFSILSLFALFILTRVLRKKQVKSLKRKLAFSTVLTFSIYSYLYVDYFVKIINNHIVNNDLRTELLQKVAIYDLRGTAFLYTPKLNNAGYKQFRRSLDLPRLNRNAFDIEVNYRRSGLLSHEFLKEVKYSIPRNVELKELEYQGNEKDYKKYQTVEKIRELQKITFIEARW